MLWLSVEIVKLPYVATMKLSYPFTKEILSMRGSRCDKQMQNFPVAIPAYEQILTPYMRPKILYRLGTADYDIAMNY